MERSNKMNLVSLSKLEKRIDHIKKTKGKLLEVQRVGYSDDGIHKYYVVVSNLTYYKLI